MPSHAKEKKKIAARGIPNLAEVAVTDIHCFAFPNQPNVTREKLEEIFSLGGPTVSGLGSVKSETQESSFESLPDYTMFLNHLSKFLNCAPNTETIIASRNKRASKTNFRSYLASLFKSVRLGTLCLDDGLFSVPLEQLKTYAPFKLYRITRIETIIKKLLENGKTKSYSDLVDEFERALLDSIRNESTIAFKSVIAYRSGLDIDPSEDESEAEKEFDQLLQGKAEISWFGPIVPKIRNSLLMKAIRKAGERGVFFEIHTGLGDTDILGSKCNPILLQRLFQDKRTMGTKIVLIHGGYPHTVEASWLARDFPNIFIELSTPHPPAFASTLNKQRFFEILSMAPPGRIVYGSDCFDLPECHWYSAKLAKLALSEALSEMLAKEMVNEDQCYAIGELVLSGNAKKLIPKD